MAKDSLQYWAILAWQEEKALCFGVQGRALRSEQMDAVTFKTARLFGRAKRRQMPKWQRLCEGSGLELDIKRTDIEPWGEREVPGL